MFKMNSVQWNSKLHHKLWLPHMFTHNRKHYTSTDTSIVANPAYFHCPLLVSSCGHNSPLFWQSFTPFLLLVIITCFWPWTASTLLDYCTLTSSVSDKFQTPWREEFSFLTKFKEKRAVKCATSFFLEITGVVSCHSPLKGWQSKRS